MCDILTDAIALGHISEIIMGQSPPGHTVTEFKDGTPFLQGCAEFCSKYPKHKKMCSSPGKICERGDILISVRAPVGELNQADQKYCIGRGLAAVRFKEGFPQNYGWHLLDFFRSILRKKAQGSTFEAVSRIDIESLPVNLLPPIERPFVATILDTVDEAIRRTEALIAKLRQVKAGMLHDLLTRGLDENGELRDPIRHPEQFKDSPLGRIPKGWGILPLCSILDFITSGSRGWAQFYTNEGPLFLRIGNLTREHINLRFDDLRHVRPPRGTEGARTKIMTGDLLISITADLGIIGCAPENIGEAYVNQHIALVRLKKELNPRWVAHYLSSPFYQRHFGFLNDSGAKAGMNLTSVGNLLVAIPDRDIESFQISKTIDDVDKQIGISGKGLKKLFLLKEGLMQDLLTGRVRVPESILQKYQAEIAAE